MVTPSLAAKEWIRHNTNLVVAAFGNTIDWTSYSDKSPEAIAFEDEVENFFVNQTGTSDRLREKWRDLYRSLMR